jgi:double-stranded uracil-DNA glycosylase
MKDARDLSKIQSFAPLAQASATTLILGSMPGVVSLAQQQYYAHPRNAFWDIMGELFGAHRELAYPRRVRVLTRQKVAVWDVLRYCRRSGSLDSAIAGEAANDFAGFFAAHARIRNVFFNGAKAETSYRRHALPLLPEAMQLAYWRLPSTSPAHAGVSYAQKLRAWRVVQEACDE